MRDEDTKFITLIGTPLSQSHAPLMQNAAYRAMGLDMRYVCMEADAALLGAVIGRVRRESAFIGAAVTKPDKVCVLQYLDGLDPLCERIGSCNTVVKLPDGRLWGYNTDCTGFYRSLTEDAGITVKGGRFLCIGAGGAGRAICSVLAFYGAEKIYISSLSPESRESAAGDINERFAPVCEAIPECTADTVRDCGVIINASGVGMGGTVGFSPLKKELMLPGRLYFDACYNPPKTRFLADAEEKGGRILNGLGMSLYQGAEQIRLWSGKDAPLELMRNELYAIITGEDRQ